MKFCPKCGSNNVITFDSDNDICQDCKQWFPAVPDVDPPKRSNRQYKFGAMCPQCTELDKIIKELTTYIKYLELFVRNVNDHRCLNDRDSIYYGRLLFDLYNVPRPKFLEDKEEK